MSADLLFTAVASGQGLQANASGKILLGGAQGGLPAGLENFTQVLLARLSENANDPKQHGKAAATPLESDNPLLTKTPKLSLAQLVGVTPEIKESIQGLEKILPEGDAGALLQALSLNQKAFDEDLKPLKPEILTSAEEQEKGRKHLPLLYELLGVQSLTSKSILDGQGFGLESNSENNAVTDSNTVDITAPHTPLTGEDLLGAALNAIEPDTAVSADVSGRDISEILDSFTSGLPEDAQDLLAKHPGWLTSLKHVVEAHIKRQAALQSIQTNAEASANAQAAALLDGNLNDSEADTASNGGAAEASIPAPVLALIERLAKQDDSITSGQIDTLKQQLAGLFAGAGLQTLPAEPLQSGTLTPPSLLTQPVEETPSLPQPFNTSDEAETLPETSDFELALEAALKGKTSAQEFQALLKNNSQNAVLHAQGLQHASSHGVSHVLQGWPFTLEGSLFAPAGFFEGSEEQYGLMPAAQAQAQLGSLSSLVTQAHSAGAPHPATALIAVNMQRAANNAGDKTLTFQLDPPELGRVRIQMSFSKDKSLKATIIAEKPESYMMLQRDAQTLERMLHDAGMDGGANLNFELAEQGFDFDQNNQRGGGHDQGGTGHDGENVELIQSTMTWHIDPQTGHMRYDILA
ncbi:MAG: flagellar hook-length control protein FliK [Alphaproteobacteria bacterium]|nr:flagellar hook-length control protein FliK [Alphaproteobacteria bacterium]